MTNNIVIYHIKSIVRFILWWQAKLFGTKVGVAHEHQSCNATEGSIGC